MRFAQRFEELRIWQDARKQVSAVYRCIPHESVDFSDFASRDQLQRAAISTMNNIAEGFERKTFKDFAHFLDLAKGSCGEVRSMLYLAENLHYILTSLGSLRAAHADVAFTFSCIFTQNPRAIDASIQ